MSTHTAAPPRIRASETSSGAFWMVATMLLGLAVAVLVLFALLMWADARDSTSSNASTTTTMSGHDHAMPRMAMTGATTSTGALTSYAGAAPANAEALAAAHKPFPAVLPTAPAGPVANVHLVLKDITVQIAPGVKYSAWACAGGAPGPA